MANKMTNKIALEIAIEAVKAQGYDAEVIEKLQKMLEQTVKKNSGERKLTATQTANLELKERILDGMEFGVPYLITDMIEKNPNLEGLSVQKVSALVRQMLLEGKLKRVELKRRSYFVINED